MTENVTTERLRQILGDASSPAEVQDLAMDALRARHSLGAQAHVIKELRSLIAKMEEVRPYVNGRPPVSHEARQKLREAWEQATPGPWGVWSSQPSVVLHQGNDPGKPIADIDTWTGRGVFDGRAMALARAYVLQLLDDLEALEASQAELTREAVPPLKATPRSDEDALTGSERRLLHCLLDLEKNEPLPVAPKAWEALLFKLVKLRCIEVVVTEKGRQILSK